MVIKDKKVFETEDGYTFNRLEDAQNHENVQELAKILSNHLLFEDSISIDELWKAKDKLIQFFIDKGYVKAI